MNLNDFFALYYLQNALGDIFLECVLKEWSKTLIFLYKYRHKMVQFLGMVRWLRPFYLSVDGFRVDHYSINPVTGAPVQSMYYLSYGHLN